MHRANPKIPKKRNSIPIDKNNGDAVESANTNSVISYGFILIGTPYCIQR